MALEAILAVEQAEQDAARKKAEAAQKAKEIAAKADREGTAAVKEAAERAAAELWTLAQRKRALRKVKRSGKRRARRWILCAVTRRTVWKRRQTGSWKGS